MFSADVFRELVKVIWIYYLLSNPYKFMRGYLYFPNNLKHIKTHIEFYIKL